MCSSTLPLTSALDGGWVVGTTPRPLYPRERTGTHCMVGRIMSMKNSSDTIGNRTRDPLTCSAVPQPTAPPRTRV